MLLSIFVRHEFALEDECFAVGTGGEVEVSGNIAEFLIA